MVLYIYSDNQIYIILHTLYIYITDFSISCHYITLYIGEINCKINCSCEQLLISTKFDRGKYVFLESSSIRNNRVNYNNYSYYLNTIIITEL